jgi:ABC-type transport system involved in multi-copper enzyme maturation permease subunit
MNNTWIIFKDEMNGMVRSWVVISLLVGLPLLSVLLYYLLPTGAQVPAMNGLQISMTFFIGILISSLGGTLAAVMLAVDIVNEKNRRVYDLLVIRPIRRADLLWAKFAAIVLLVSLACLLSLATGLVVDALRGTPITAFALQNAGEAMIGCIGTMCVSAAGGVIAGMLSPSVLIAVLFVMYGTQNLTLIPMIPTYFGLPDLLWLSLAVSIAISVGMLYGAGIIFKRKEL